MNIRFVAKTSDIRNFFENIRSDVKTSRVATLALFARMAMARAWFSVIPQQQRGANTSRERTTTGCLQPQEPFSCFGDKAMPSVCWSLASISSFFTWTPKHVRKWKERWWRQAQPVETSQLKSRWTQMNRSIVKHRKVTFCVTQGLCSHGRHGPSTVF